MTSQLDPEDESLRAVALQNVQSIRLARQRAEEQLADAREALHEETRVLELLNRTGTLLASSLELRAIVQAVTDAATELSGAEFGAFFDNVTDESGEAFQLYTLSGAPPEAFEQFGRPVATALFGPTFPGEPSIRFHGEPSIRSGDIRQDHRYATTVPPFGMPEELLPVRSFLAVPVRSRTGAVLGGLFFGHSQPDHFSERSERLVVGIASQAGIAIDNARLFETVQKTAAERNVLLESERAARAAAERLSGVKDDFLATLSHELRTPLNAILGWAHVLRTTAGDQRDLAKGLDTIIRNARMQAQMIEDLLDMSRITSGKLRLDVQSVSPIAFIEAAIETVKPAADAKQIRLEALLDPAAGRISGDPSRLQQVIWNLLSNAIKFTPEGGKVQVLLERADSQIEITVADTGAGIRPEVIPHLFDRFRQGDASTTRGHGGLGLGLSIVKNLVELHGGTVRVTSSGENRGTTAAVHLPLLVPRPPAGNDGGVHPKALVLTSTAATSEFDGVKVLVVDDQLDGRELIKRILEDCGAEVFIAAGADEALTLLEYHRPDILVSDIGMPGVDGYELLQRIRHTPGGNRIPAIALTAFARSEDRTRALRAGFVVHVSKPVDPAELIATVASVVARL